MLLEPLFAPEPDEELFIDWRLDELLRLKAVPSDPMPEVWLALELLELPAPPLPALLDEPVELLRAMPPPDRRAPPDRLVLRDEPFMFELLELPEFDALLFDALRLVLLVSSAPPWAVR